MMRRFVPSLLLLVIVFVFAADALAGSVRGYTRRDGTYVAPHQRSAPDGNPYNNYGYPGNYNPNTGTITPGDPDKYLERYYEKSRGSGATTRPTGTPDSTTAPSSSSANDHGARIAARIKQTHGVEVDPSRPLLELLDVESRLNTVARIMRTHGTNVSPDASLLKLLDTESRLNTAKRISDRHRLVVSPDAYSLSGLLDLESRLNSATRIRERFGVSIDPSTHSLFDLMTIESRLMLQNRRPTTSSAPVTSPPASRPSNPCSDGHYWHSSLGRCDKIGG